MSQIIKAIEAGTLPPSVPTSFVTNSGTAIPTGNILNVLGATSTGISFSGSGNTITGTLANIPNSSLTNSSITINTGSGLSGGGIVSLGGSITLVATNTGTITSVTTSNATPQFVLTGTVENVNFALSNLALGSSLASVTAAVQNVAYGSSALNAITSGIQNSAIGFNSMLLATTGNQNTAIGYDTLATITGGGQNVAIGASALGGMTAGSNNTVIGYTAGSAYTAGNSNNILIGAAVTGVAGETFVTRIGNAQTSCYITGIEGVTVATPQYVTIDPSTNQLGSTAINASGFPWTDVTVATQNLAVNNGYVTDHTNVTYTLPATAALGDTIIIVGKLGITTIAQNAGQQIIFSSASSTVGVTGSAIGTNVGDCCTLICITIGTNTVWRAKSFVGNWNIS